jgi:ketosteroid isomerase-like protein
VAARFEPGFEWHPDELSPGQRTRHTADEAVDTVRDFTSPFSDFHTEVVGLTTQGPHVIAEVHHVGEVGAGKVERREVHVWTFRGGTPVSLREFETREEALAYLEDAAPP